MRDREKYDKAEAELPQEVHQTIKPITQYVVGFEICTMATEKPVFAYWIEDKFVQDGEKEATVFTNTDKMYQVLNALYRRAQEDMGVGYSINMFINAW